MITLTTKAKMTGLVNFNFVSKAFMISRFERMAEKGIVCYIS